MGAPTLREALVVAIPVAVSLGTAWWLKNQLNNWMHVIQGSRPQLIILVRHAESEGNVDEAVYRQVADHAIRLTERGRTQAKSRAKALKELIGCRPVFVYISPYRRTEETAELCLSELAPEQIVQKRTDSRLREQEFAGTFQGDMNPSKEERKSYGAFFFRFRGGESGADVYDRVSLFLETLYRDFRHRYFSDDTCVVIFSHGLTNRMFLMRWLHWDLATFERTKNPGNAEFLVLERQPRDAARQRYFKLTPDSLEMLGLPGSAMESKPTSWPLPDRLAGLGSPRRVHTTQSCY